MTDSGGAEAPLYDALAEGYADLSAKRSIYLRAIEALVLEAAPRPTRRYLDIGAGDGARSLALVEALRNRDGAAPETFLLEPSGTMLEYARKAFAAVRHGATYLQTTGDALPEEGPRFELATCLWNVLGHVPNRAARVATLSRIRHRLAPGGRLAIDVNNRHNAAAYGARRVLLRQCIDRIWPDERRGDATVTWEVGGRKVTGAGHLFTPHEARRLFAEAGLRVVSAVAVDYVTGAASPRLTEGQLFFVLEAREGNL